MITKCQSTHNLHKSEGPLLVGISHLWRQTWSFKMFIESFTPDCAQKVRSHFLLAFWKFFSLVINPGYGLRTKSQLWGAKTHILVLVSPCHSSMTLYYFIFENVFSYIRALPDTDYMANVEYDSSLSCHQCYIKQRENNSVKLEV